MFLLLEAILAFVMLRLSLASRKLYESVKQIRENSSVNRKNLMISTLNRVVGAKVNEQERLTISQDMVTSLMLYILGETLVRFQKKVAWLRMS